MLRKSHLGEKPQRLDHLGEKGLQSLIFFYVNGLNGCSFEFHFDEHGVYGK